MRGKKDSRILYCSNKLFLCTGYAATTMRQIAEETGTSLGLATYHFKSKEKIAVRVMEGYLHYLKQQLGRQLVARKQPLVHSAAMVRLCIDFFMSHPCKQFYLDCLKQEIYMEAIQNLGNQGLGFIAEAHDVDVSPDLLLLFDNYIPPSVEKILILEKEKGGFPGISYDEIPDIVFSVSVEKYLDKKEIAEAAKIGKEVSHEVLAGIPDDITSTLFLVPEEQYVEHNITLR